MQYHACFVNMVKKEWMVILGAVVVQSAFALYTFLPLVGGPVQAPPKTRILSASGELLHAVGPGGGEALTMEELRALPAYVPAAFVAAEDQHFYQHQGVDFGALVTSLGRRGGSTITSQMVKVQYFPEEPRHVLQKAREFVLALALDLTSSKEEILRTYLSSVSFGRGYVGLRAAAEGYFGKDPSMLSLGEAAMLAGLLPAPDRYSPVVSRERAEERRRLVLRRMREEGMLTETQEREASEIPVEIVSQTQQLRAPHAAMAALAEAKALFPDVEKGGYTITTGIDLAWHDEMTTVLRRSVGELRDKKVSNGAAVVMDPETGTIRVMVGSLDYFGEGGAFNVALAKRQPGSSLKPFTYLAVFLAGKSPGSIVYDVETSFPTTSGDVYMPRNYDLQFHGPVTLRAALGSSLNIPAVKVLDMVGFPAFYALMADFGITFAQAPEHYGLGITLGGGEVTLTELTHAYSMLANGGQRTRGHLVTRIEHGGRILYEAPGKGGALRTEKAFAPAVAMVTDILRDNRAREISFGLTSRLRITDSVAVKTGTTKDYRDNWAFGYTPAITVGVWVGNNDNRPMEGVTGISGAIPVLHDFLRLRTRETAPAVAGTSALASLEKVRICALSGLLATDICPLAYDEWFFPGTAPTERDTWYRTVEIDGATGRLADESCPDRVIKKTFAQVPPELSRWAASVLLERAPTVTCSGRETLPTATTWTLSHPKDGDRFVLQPDIPAANQRLPLHIDGEGYIRTDIFLDGKPMRVEGALPLTTFIDLTPGEHIVMSSGTTLRYSVRTNE